MENLKLRRAAIEMIRGYRQLARLEDCDKCGGKGCSQCNNTGSHDWKICKHHAFILQEMTRALVPEEFDLHFYRDPKIDPRKLFHKLCLNEVVETRNGHFCTGHGSECGRKHEDLLGLLEHQLFHDDS